MASLKIASITVSACSRRNTGNYESADNFTSFDVRREEGEFTPEEALLTKVRMTLAIWRTLLLEELSLGLVSKEDYQKRLSMVEKRYGAILRKLEQDPGVMFRDPKTVEEEECLPTS